MKVLLALALACLSLTLAPPAGASTGSKRTHTTPEGHIVARFYPTAGLKSGGVITCTTKVDDVHRSTSTDLPNVHGKVQCDAVTKTIVVQVYIYREGRQVGASGIVQVFKYKYLVETANSAICVTGNYSGDEAGYIQAPPGYTPFEQEFYSKGPTHQVTCGPCGRVSEGLGEAARSTHEALPATQVEVPPFLTC